MVALQQFDCVVSYHHNVHTCGVARFNRRLADFLGVPMVRISDLRSSKFVYPIVSVKSSEMEMRDHDQFQRDVLRIPQFVLMIHDYREDNLEIELMRHATKVVALNSELASRARVMRPDIIEGFAVASYTELPSPSAPELTLITFGMAHKIQSHGYQRVGDLLQNDGRSFVLEISSALHEGTAFDDSFFEVGHEISSCFQGNVDFLGFLADQEVVRRLTSASAMLAFFPHGARENNTSLISAMSLGVPVITNLDSWSPGWMVHGETIFDVNSLSAFPPNDVLQRVGASGKSAVRHLSFSGLMSLLSDDKNNQS